MRLLLLLSSLLLASGSADAGWGDALCPVKTDGPPAGLREGPCEVQSRPAGCPTCGPKCDCSSCGCDSRSWVSTCGAVPAKIKLARPPAPAPVVRQTFAPAAEVPAPRPFPVRDVPHAGHSCPTCGHTSYETHMVRGWVGGGRHRHVCPLCQTSWVH